ncbi:MAG TPA: hypothetical protein VIJ16_00790 [Gemmatimonadaceae bacterium]
MVEVPKPTADSVPVGRTANTQYFRVDPDILIVLPDTNLKDDGPSARMNTDFQIRFARELGRPVAVVVHMTSLLSQDSEARRIYAERMEPTQFFAAALVAANPISRAIASFFLGLTKPRFPTRVFGSYDAALEWAATMRPRDA